jgi:hypothetical protein
MHNVNLGLFLALRAVHPHYLARLTKHLPGSPLDQVAFEGWVRRQGWGPASEKFFQGTFTTRVEWAAWEAANRPWPVDRQTLAEARERASRSANPAVRVLAWSALRPSWLGRLTGADVQRRKGGLYVFLGGPKTPVHRERWAIVHGPGRDALRALADEAGDGPLVPASRHALKNALTEALGMPCTDYRLAVLREAYDDAGLPGVDELVGWPYAEMDAEARKRLAAEEALGDSESHLA